MAKRVKYPDGGTMSGGPGDPITVDQWNQLKQKYAGNLPKVRGEGALDHRMEWVQWANKALPTSGTPAELSKKAAQATGFKNPALLLSSSMEEGVGLRYGNNSYSDAYTEAKVDQKKFPVDGFRNYGLDQIGGRVDEFIQKGYLPKDFKNNMQAFKASNEQDENEYYSQAFKLGQSKGLLDKNLKYKSGDYDLYDKVDAAFKDYKGTDLPKMKQSAYTAAFTNDESAYMAKAAFMRAEQDNVMNYAKKKGYTLTPDEQDFFTLASYNGGAGNGQAMLDYYGGKKELGNNGFLKDRGNKGGVYDNILSRYAGAKLFTGEKYFEKGGRMKMELGDEIDPITGKPKAPQLGGNPADNSVFAPSGEGFPSRNQQPGDLLTISHIGDPVKQDTPVVPLSQFYDTAYDKFGNKVLQGTGKYVNDQGQVNTVADQQVFNDQISADNLANANRISSIKDNVELAASTGITAINSFFAKKDAAKQNRLNTRKAILDESFANKINPYMEGTGSQAIFEHGGSIHIKKENRGKFTAAAKKAGMSVQGYAAKIMAHPDNYSPTLRKRANFARNAAKFKHEDGGEINGDHLGLETLDGGKTTIASTSDHSNPMVEFSGKEHKDGGIGISYGGKIAEVEDKEFGFIDQEGGLNIFGKLKVPGTNQTFRSLAKEVAKEEKKVDGQKSKYLAILNNVDPADKYQETANSTAKVMFKSLDKQSKEIAEKKEAMASYQNLILGMQQEKMAYGGKIPKYDDGGKIDPSDTKKIQAIIDKYSGGKSPLKAEDFVEVSKKYNVPLELMLAQAIQESNFGTKGLAAKTHNIFNVGNNGNTGKKTEQGDYKTGLENYAKLISSDYATDGKVDVQGLLNSNFQRPKKGGNYAEEKDYATNIARVMSEITGGNYSASDPGYPKSFKKYKDISVPDGLSPAAFYKDPDVVQALKDDKTFSSADDAVFGPEHLKIWNKLSQEKKDALLKKSQNSVTNNTNIGNTNDNVDLSVPKYTQISGSTDPKDQTIDTPYGKANYQAPALVNNPKMSTGDLKRDFLSPLAVEQIAPELLTMATNRRDPVEQRLYQPDLKQTFDISYQLGRNTNQSSFNQIAKILENNGNTDAISELAAQKYNADQQYNMQEIQGNAQQKQQVYNENVNTLNDAQLRNLALISDQQTKQAQAKFNTRKEDLGAFGSIASKVLQNNLENKTYNAYASLFKHYGFDKKGNVTFNPDDVVEKFTPGEAQHFGMVAAQRGLQSLQSDATKTSTKVDKEGNVKQTTYVNDDLQEFNQIMGNKDIDPAYKQKLLKGNKYAERYYAPD